MIYSLKSTPEAVCGPSDPRAATRDLAESVTDHPGINLDLQGPNQKQVVVTRPIKNSIGADQNRKPPEVTAIRERQMQPLP